MYRTSLWFWVALLSNHVVSHTSYTNEVVQLKVFLQKPSRFASTIKANGTVYFEDHFTATHKQIKVQCLPDHLTVEKCSVYQYNLKNLLEHCPSKFYGNFYLKITLVNVLLRLHLFSMYISGLMDENK